MISSLLYPLHDRICGKPGPNPAALRQVRGGMLNAFVAARLSPKSHPCAWPPNQWVRRRADDLDRAPCRSRQSPGARSSAEGAMDPRDADPHLDMRCRLEADDGGDPERGGSTVQSANRRAGRGGAESGRPWERCLCRFRGGTSPGSHTSSTTLCPSTRRWDRRCARPSPL